MRRRWTIFLIGLPLYALALMMVGTLVGGGLLADDRGAFLHDVVELLWDPGWWLGAGTAAVAVVASQAVLLIPAFQFRRARAERGKSLLVSAILLALLASMLVTGLVAGLLELLGPWGQQPSVMGGTSSVDVVDQWWFVIVFWTSLGISWLLFSVALTRLLWRSPRPEGKMGRIVGVLIGGTILEALAILPIDVMVRRRTDCYCNTGTFLALAFSIAAAIWLTGPGVFIALTSRQRRAWYESHCDNCGYAKGPTPGHRCPECGQKWELKNP